MFRYRDTQAGIAGGTLTGLLSVVSSHDLLRTFILAAVGAAASFIVSFLLQWLTRRKG